MITVCPVNAQESQSGVVEGGQCICLALCTVYVCIGFQGFVLYLRQDDLYTVNFQENRHK